MAKLSRKRIKSLGIKEAKEELFKFQKKINPEPTKDELVISRVKWDWSKIISNVLTFLRLVVRILELTGHDRHGHNK